MNSKLLEMLKHLYTTAVQDADGVMAGRKGYRMRYDEVPEQMEKAIRQAVGKEMLEIIGENDHETRGTTQNPNNEKYHTRKSKNRNELKAEIRQKIKQWQGGEDET